MENSRPPRPLPAEAAVEAGLFTLPADTTSMTKNDYEQLIAALSTAAGILSLRRAELNAADLRIRSLVVIAEKEAKRALLETRSRYQPVDTQSRTSIAK